MRMFFSTRFSSKVAVFTHVSSCYLSIIIIEELSFLYFIYCFVMIIFFIRIMCN
jgi:hypothetical protein